MKEQMSLEGFIKYAKDEFGVDIICDYCAKPDTFESIFGFSTEKRKQGEAINTASPNLKEGNSDRKC